MKMEEKAGGDVGNEGVGWEVWRVWGETPPPPSTLIGFVWCIAWIGIGCIGLDRW